MFRKEKSKTIITRLSKEQLEKVVGGLATNEMNVAISEGESKNKPGSEKQGK